jgi:hypothetical protein
LDGDDPAFSQGAFQQGRERLIRHQLDRRLLERTIEVAKETKAFDFKKLQKLRVAVDSRPFEGAGRVEDTFNLLGHAGKKVAACAAKQLGSTVEEVCRQAGAPLLLGSSTKAALDIDWNSAEQKAEALNRLCIQLGRRAAWVERHLEVVEESGVSHLIVPDVVVTDSGWLGGATKRHGRVTEEGSGLEGRFGASQPVLEGEASEHSRDPRDGPRYPVRVGMRAKAPNLVPFGCGR